MPDNLLTVLAQAYTGRVSRRQDAFLRWTLALSWTAFCLLLMLLPDEGTIVNALSLAAGGGDLTDALGHVFLFGVLTLLWYAALLGRESKTPAMRQRDLWVAVGVGWLVSTASEVGQAFVPGRGMALLDLVANIFGPAVVLLWLRRRVGR